MLFWRLVSPEARVDASELMLRLRFPRSAVKFVPMTSPRSHGFHAPVKQIRLGRKRMQQQPCGRLMIGMTAYQARGVLTFLNLREGTDIGKTIVDSWTIQFRLWTWKAAENSLFTRPPGSLVLFSTSRE